MSQSLASFLTEIADAIRQKKNTSNNIKASDFVDEILSIGNISYLDYRNDDTLPTLLHNIAEAIRIKRGISGQINAQDFADEILQIVTSNTTAILGKAILGYAILGKRFEDEVITQLDAPFIYLSDADGPEEADFYPLSLDIINVNILETIPSVIYKDEELRFTLTPLPYGYLPDSLSVTGAEYSYDAATGILVLHSPYASVRVQGSGIAALQLMTPTLSLDTNTGILTIGNIDPSANVYYLYVNDELSQIWLPAAPTTLKISYYDKAYVIAKDTGGAYPDSASSNTINYILGSLSTPSIFLQTGDILDSPSIAFDDNYNILITAVANADKYFIYYDTSGGEPVAQIAADGIEAGMIINTEIVPDAGAHAYVTAVDTSGVYKTSDISNLIYMPLGPLATPTIYIVDQCLDTPAVRLDGNKVVIIGVPTADTYKVYVKDLITSITTTHTLNITLEDNQEYTTDIRLISNQSARVKAIDSSGNYEESSICDALIYTEQLSDPVISVDPQSARLQISGSLNATHYEVYINDAAEYQLYIPGATNISVNNGDIIKATAKDNTGRYLASDQVEFIVSSIYQQLSTPQIYLDAEQHTHTYTSSIIAPTCTDQGYTLHTCSGCESSYKDNYTDALGHNFTSYVADGNATCTADGTKTAKCSRCTQTHTVSDVGSALGHDWSDVYSSVFDFPTTGYGRKCSRCGEIQELQKPQKLATPVISLSEALITPELALGAADEDGEYAELYLASYDGNADEVLLYIDNQYQRTFTPEQLVEGNGICKVRDGSIAYVVLNDSNGDYSYSAESNRIRYNAPIYKVTVNVNGVTITPESGEFKPYETLSFTVTSNSAATVTSDDIEIVGNCEHNYSNGILTLAYPKGDIRVTIDVETPKLLTPSIYLSQDNLVTTTIPVFGTTGTVGIGYGQDTLTTVYKTTGTIIAPGEVIDASISNTSLVQPDPAIRVDGSEISWTLYSTTPSTGVMGQVTYTYKESTSS